MNKQVVSFLGKARFTQAILLLSFLSVSVTYPVLHPAKREAFRNTMVRVDNIWSAINPDELAAAVEFNELTGNFADVTAGALNSLRRFREGFETINLLDFSHARRMIKETRRFNTARRNVQGVPTNVYRSGDEQIEAVAKGCTSCGEKTPVVFINHEPRLISANNIRYSTFIIDEPGYYILTQDAEFDPTFPSNFMISIQADNVLLDLNTKLLTQKLSNTQPDTHGINIQAGRSNVTVKNGAVVNTTGIGVVVEEGCCGINLCDLVIKNADFGGIYFVGSDPDGTTSLLDSPFQPSGSFARVQECIVKNCHVTKCGGVLGQILLRGMVLINSDNFVVEDCSFNNNGSSILERTRALTGADTHNVRLVRTQLNDNLANDFECVGCFLLHCQNWEVVDCSASKNECLSGATEGFSDAGGKGNLFQGCVANCNVAQNRNVIGFKTAANIFNVEHAAFNNCHADGNRAGTGAIGFAALDGSIGNVYESCFAIDNAGGVTLPAVDEESVGSDINAGFALLKAEQCTIINSVAQEIHALDQSATTSGLTFGILIAPDFDLDLTSSPTIVTPLPSFHVIRNNTIINNVGTTQVIVPFFSGTPFVVKSFGLKYLDFATFFFGELERPLHGPAQVVTDLITNNFAYGNGTVTNRDCNYAVAPYVIGSFPVTCGNIGNVVPVTSAQTLDNIELRVGSC